MSDYMLPYQRVLDQSWKGIPSHDWSRSSLNFSLNRSSSPSNFSNWKNYPCFKEILLSNNITFSLNDDKLLFQKKKKNIRVRCTATSFVPTFMGRHEAIIQGTGHVVPRVPRGEFCVSHSEFAFSIDLDFPTDRFTRNLGLRPDKLVIRGRRVSSSVNIDRNYHPFPTRPSGEDNSVTRSNPSPNRVPETGGYRGVLNVFQRIDTILEYNLPNRRWTIQKIFWNWNCLLWKSFEKISFVQHVREKRNK